MAGARQCDRCGALLPSPDLAGYTSCPSCGGVSWTDPAEPVDGAAAAPTSPAPSASAAAAPRPPAPGGRPRPTPDRSPSGRRRGAGLTGLLGCLPALLVALVVLAVAVAALSSSGSSDGPSADDEPSTLYPTGGSTFVLPGEPSAPADLVLMANDNRDGESRRVLVRVALGADGGEERWRSDALPEDAYAAPMATDGTHLFVALDDEVWNLSVRTGERLWRATVSDRITVNCPDCFAVVDGTLVVRTDDAHVTAFAAGSAEPRWSRRLVSAAGGVSVAGDTLLVVDDEDAPTHRTLASVVDPRTGATTATAHPTCPESDQLAFEVELDAGDDVRLVPGTGDVVAAFDTSFGCVVRWELATGTIRWATGFGPGLHATDDEPLLTATDLVFARTGGELVHVDLATGRPTELAPLLDRSAVPRQIVGRTLLADTTTTRGSTRAGLAAWDLTTGEPRWDVALADGAEPLDAGPGSPFAATLTAGRPATLLVAGGPSPRLLTFVGDDRELRTQTVDPGTGELGVVRRRIFPTRYDSGTPSLTVEAVEPSRLVLTIDSLVAVVPLDTDAPISRFPEG